MHRSVKDISIAFVVFSFVAACAVQPSSAQSARKSLVVVFTDGHQKSFSMAEVARIEFRDGKMVLSRNGQQESISVSEIARIDFDNSDQSASRGRNHFVGKWEVGDGVGGKFFITLEADGHARKTIGGRHGTWALVEGEARISWDDGWHDAIRRVGGKHEKVAYEPGKSFNDEPSNIADARNTNPEPI